MEDNQPTFRDLCKNTVIYPENFVRKFGIESRYWTAVTSWMSKELSLRHDMICILLCNQEPLETVDVDNKIHELIMPPAKRRKLNENVASTSSSSNSDEVTKYIEDHDTMAEKLLKNVPKADRAYRYIVLEGRSDLVQLQNTLAVNFNIRKPTKEYDIFDRKEEKFIEVKCTVNFEREVDIFEESIGRDGNVALVHVHPHTRTFNYMRKKDKMPGEAKVVNFLMARSNFLNNQINMVEPTVDMSEGLVNTIFCSPQLDELCKEWTNMWWLSRNLEVMAIDKDPPVGKKIGKLCPKKLKSLIEDTRLRDAPFMQWKAKLLPDCWTASIYSEREEDEMMLEELLKDLTFVTHSDEALQANAILNHWNTCEDRSTFQFLSKSEIFHLGNKLSNDLGIGMKKTVKHDDHEDLRVPIFQSNPKRRYAAWFGHVLRDMCEESGSGLEFMRQFISPEEISTHPYAHISATAMKDYFRLLNKTYIAIYVSKVKNFYSRLGGAYLSRKPMKKNKRDTCIFPIYSTGFDRGGRSVRRVTGFVLRGPHHAKQPTDRISIITFEMLKQSEKQTKFNKYIRNASFLLDSKNRVWCRRVNSVLKHDTSFLAFPHNCLYLGANLLGELTVNKPDNPASFNVCDATRNFVETWPLWIKERVAESVFMAVMGTSQEEGGLAILRKMFMLKLNWARDQSVNGADIEGFAEAINECLLDGAFILYLTHHFREML